MESAFDRITRGLSGTSLSRHDELLRNLGVGASTFDRSLARDLFSIHESIARFDPMNVSSAAKVLDEATGLAHLRPWFEQHDSAKQLFADLLPDFREHDFFRTIEDTKRIAELAGVGRARFAMDNMLGTHQHHVGQISGWLEPHQDVFAILERSVAEIAFPLASFDFTEQLGSRFLAREFFSLRRADEIRTYLYRTELPALFVEAPAEFVDASLVDLGLVKPLRAGRMDDASPRRIKGLQRGRNHDALRDAFAWLEATLRATVDAAMSRVRGADWARSLTNAEDRRWAVLFDKKQDKVWCSGYRPRTVIEASQFSELLAFAFLSDECAPHICCDDPMSKDELRVEIDRLVEARNALFHGYCRANPSQVTITFGVLVKLAGVAGLKLPQDDWIRAVLYGEGADDH